LGSCCPRIFAPLSSLFEKTLAVVQLFDINIYGAYFVKIEFFEKFWCCPILPKIVDIVQELLFGKNGVVVLKNCCTYIQGECILVVFFRKFDTKLQNVTIRGVTIRG